MRRAVPWWIAIAWIAGLVLATPAHAHKPSDAYVQVAVSGAVVEERIDIALRDLERELALDADDDGQIIWREVRQRWADIDRLARQGLLVQADGLDCTGPSGSVAQLDEHSDGRYAVVTFRRTCPAPVQQLSLDYRLFEKTDPTHRGVVLVQASMPAGDVNEPAVLVPGSGARTFTLDGHEVNPEAGTGARPSPGFLGFVAQGIHHILIGSDHVLFLLALLLPAVMRRSEPRADGATVKAWAAAPALLPVLMDVFRIVTAFTVAHSITLALATFDVLNPPSRWIESVIAASVVLAALNNLYPLIREGRWKLTFVFGLVHGFGFASALKNLGLDRGALALPLFGFNLGVEVGQLSIVALFLLLVWPMRRTAFYRRGLIAAGSSAIALLALGWLVERAFDVNLAIPA